MKNKQTITPWHQSQKVNIPINPNLKKDIEDHLFFSKGKKKLYMTNIFNACYSGKGTREEKKIKRHKANFLYDSFSPKMQGQKFLFSITIRFNTATC